ncbi:family 78 glycoside hydrolase catalytic domain [Frondihabitans sp. PAMC 28766]|uniref:family 78 glycoside hydrolase catalytic domain n=1 Tax=Frondihabitans sp. PAMC 28766 TaxID=1795630 RepID=UPI0009E8AA03|nr:family 78 glycoside hydrolase catalytic domain [Frondihabitans sp. PAMC 28766]
MVIEQTNASPPTRPAEDPLTFVHATQPRLSWRITGAPSGWRQRRAEIEAHYADGRRRTATLNGDQQVLVSWPFPTLAARERVTVRVRVTGEGPFSKWSPGSAIEVSPLDPSDWTAHWITPVSGATSQDPAPIIGTTFLVDEGLTSARLHLSALGIAVIYLNGQRVGEDQFVPGWTTYDRLIRFRSYNVTEMLSAGPVDVAALLGNGWYRGRIASLPIHRDAFYGDDLALLCQLELTYADGRQITIGTDDSWAAGSSQVLANDFYDGQTTDLRRSSSPTLTTPVTYSTAPVGRVQLATAPPVRELEALKPLQISRKGATIVADVGRNVVGWARLRVRGNHGDLITVRHAEVLENGELSVRPLRSAEATDRYYLAGSGDEFLEPQLTYHGFRYIEISGLPEGALLDLEAVVVGSALTPTASLDTSHPGLNQLHRNVVNSMVGNFLDIPTDCPQRDERLGWTGDAQVFAPTATTLFDVSRFLNEWVESLAVDQLEDGTVPAVVPRVFPTEQPLAGWGDAAVIVPWVLYQRYGDLDVLRRQYPSMTAWVERVRSLAGDTLLWTGGEQLGDWLDPLAPPDEPAAAQADPDVVATASFFHSTDILAQVAAVLDNTSDAKRYADMADGIRDAFCNNYVDAQGRVASDCQTVYALALAWGILRAPRIQDLAGRRLAELVESQGFTVATGFLGTPVVLQALTSIGRSDDAYRMLTNREFPGWLYAVDLGATTIWERWDSLQPDGSVNPGTMTSFNHYAFGAVASWMHEHIGGISPVAPGAREVRVAPLPSDEVTSARMSYESPYGPIQTSWTARIGQFHVEVDIPVGVTATVQLPDGAVFDGIEHGHHRFNSDIQFDASLVQPENQQRLG